MKPDELLDIARDFANTNLLQATMRDVPVPAAAVDDADPWFFDGEKPSRTVYAGRWPIGNVNALVVGEQQADGTATWQIEVQHVERTVGDLTAEQARELSRVLLDAADKLDKLKGSRNG